MASYFVRRRAAWLCGIWAMATPAGAVLAGSPARASYSPSVGQIFHVNPQAGFTQRSMGYDSIRVAPSIPRYSGTADTQSGGARYYGGRYYTNQHFTHSHSALYDQHKFNGATYSARH